MPVKEKETTAINYALLSSLFSTPPEIAGIIPPPPPPLLIRKESPSLQHRAKSCHNSTRDYPDGI